MGGKDGHPFCTQPVGMCGIFLVIALDEAAIVQEQAGTYLKLRIGCIGISGGCNGPFDQLLLNCR